MTLDEYEATEKRIIEMTAKINAKFNAVISRKQYVNQVMDVCNLSAASHLLFDSLEKLKNYSNK